MEALITKEQIKQLEQLTGNQVVEEVKPGFCYMVKIKKTGKVEKWWSDKILKRIAFELNKQAKLAEKQQGLNFASLFHNADKKPVKKFKTLGTSVEEDIYFEVKKIADKHNMSIHTLLKRMVMQLIEAEK